MRRTRSRRKQKEMKLKAMNTLRFIVGTILTIYVLYSISRDIGLC